MIYFSLPSFTQLDISNSALCWFRVSLAGPVGNEHTCNNRHQFLRILCGSIWRELPLHIDYIIKCPDTCCTQCDICHHTYRVGVTVFSWDEFNVGTFMLIVTYIALVYWNRENINEMYWYLWINWIISVHIFFCRVGVHINFVRIKRVKVIRFYEQPVM